MGSSFSLEVSLFRLSIGEGLAALATVRRVGRLRRIDSGADTPKSAMAPVSGVSFLSPLPLVEVAAGGGFSFAPPARLGLFGYWSSLESAPVISSSLESSPGGSVDSPLSSLLVSIGSSTSSLHMSLRGT